MGVLFTEDKAQELYAMVKENNRMLKEMRRSAFIGGVLHFVWLILFFIVVPYITWLFIQPYLDGMLKAYESAQGQSTEFSKAIEDLRNAGSGFDLQKFFDQFRSNSTN